MIANVIVNHAQHHCTRMELRFPFFRMGSAAPELGPTPKFTLGVWIFAAEAGGPDDSCLTMFARRTCE